MDNLADKIMEAVKNPKMNVSEDYIKDLKKKVLESLFHDRTKIILRDPFIGGMLMRFELLPIRDLRVNTACTDGTRIFFDMDFYTKLSDDERVFVLAHECWHCIYLHFLRKQNRNVDIWNIATDCEINYMLKNNGYKSPEELLYPERNEEGLSAEEIYTIREKQFKKQNKKNENCNDSSENGKNGEKSSSNKNDKSGKNGNDKLTGQFDKHISKGEESEDESSDNGILPKDQWGEKGFDSDYCPHISSDVSDKIREAVISEAQKIERNRGTIPSHLTQIINSFRKPEVSWKELLCQEVTRCYSEKREWLPPNRRYIHNGIYLQSRRGERMKCTVLLDTSGSTTADLPKFMGELVSLLNTFSNYDMTLIQCDAAVQSVETYNDENPFPLEDCSKIKFSGFGGSDFTPAFKHLETMDEYPNMVIIFTDGYITVPKNPPPCNVIWILTNDANVDVAKYGKKIVFKEKIENDV